MDESEYRTVQKIARRSGATVAEWVRQTLRAALRQAPLKGTERKLAALRAASLHRFPAPDIEQMLAEIEQGYERGPES